MVSRGFNVFPLRPNSKDPYERDTCQAHEYPLSGGIHAATKDEKTIASWFSLEPNLNIGVSTTGSCVIDIDVKKGKNGVEEFMALGVLPKTLRVRTPSGGFHDYFADADCGQRKISDAIDVRSRGGYVVGPGSRIDGKAYKIVCDSDVAPLPAVLAEKVQAAAEKHCHADAVCELDIVGIDAFAEAYLVEQKGVVEHEGIGRDNTAYKHACYLKDLGISAEMSVHLLDDHWNHKNTPPLSKADLKRITKSAAANSQKAAGSRNPLIEFESILAACSDDPKLVKALTNRTRKSGRPKWVSVKDEKPRAKHIGNLEAFLDWLGVTVRLNEFYHKKFMTGSMVGELDDTAFNRLYSEAGKIDYRISIDDLQRYLAVIAADRAYHPVKDYLFDLKWDGVPRIDNWLSIYCGSIDSEFIRVVGRLSLIAACRRVITPGIKFDHMLILEGEQGTGKSSAIKILAGDWFSDAIKLGDSPKEMMEKLPGVWLAEISELATKRNTDVEIIKAQLSRTSDTDRMAYGREPVTRLRQNTFIGTTNRGDYLIDPTGNRRLWPVEVGQIKTDELLRDRDQLWAEAHHYAIAGETLALPERLYSDAAKAQESKRYKSQIEEQLYDLLCETDSGFIPMGDLWKALGRGADNKARQTDTERDKIANTMKKLGWEVRRRKFLGNAKRQRGYEKRTHGQKSPPLLKYYPHVMAFQPHEADETAFEKPDWPGDENQDLNGFTHH